MNHFHCCDEVDADEAYERGRAEGYASGVHDGRHTACDHVDYSGIISVVENAKTEGYPLPREPRVMGAVMRQEYALAHERSAGAAPLDVDRLRFALHEHYGEGVDDTCWHDHDAERVARIYERAEEYGLSEGDA